MDDLPIVPVDEPPTVSEKTPIEAETQVDENAVIQIVIHTSPVEL